MLFTKSDEPCTPSASDLGCAKANLFIPCPRPVSSCALPASVTTSTNSGPSSLVRSSAGSSASESRMSTATRSWASGACSPAGSFLGCVLAGRLGTLMMSFIHVWSRALGRRSRKKQGM